MHRNLKSNKFMSTAAGIFITYSNTVNGSISHVLQCTTDI